MARMIPLHIDDRACCREFLKTIASRERAATCPSGSQPDDYHSADWIVLHSLDLARAA